MLLIVIVGMYIIKHENNVSIDRRVEDTLMNTEQLLIFT